MTPIVSHLLKSWTCGQTLWLFTFMYPLALSIFGLLCLFVTDTTIFTLLGFLTMVLNGAGQAIPQIAVTKLTLDHGQKYKSKLIGFQQATSGIAQTLLPIVGSYLILILPFWVCCELFAFLSFVCALILNILVINIENNHKAAAQNEETEVV